MSPLNVGTSNFGNLKPLFSDGRVKASDGMHAGDINFLILTEQSNT